LFNNFNQDNIQNLNNYESFKWPKNENGYFLTENQAISHIIDHLSKYIKNENYEIKDVRDNYAFYIQTMNIHFTGKPDAVIAPNNHQGLERETRVCFEFKTPQSLKKPCQRILEFIASCIFSLHPVMVVQTDLINNFYLLIGQNKTIYEYHSTDASKSIQYINYWLNTQTNDKLNSYNQMMIHCKMKNSYFENLIYSNGIQFTKKINFNKKLIEISNKQEQEQNKEKVKKIINALDKSHERTKISGRSGICYKIVIDNKQYVLKLHNTIASDDTNILQEMINESSIYKFLKNETEGNWPTLYYSGLIFDIYYAICTDFIDGECYNPEEFSNLSFKNKLKSYCMDTIKEFHKKGILHGDIRAPNFIFKDNSAFIIDFGFSLIVKNNELSNHHFQEEIDTLNKLFII
jgi:hypothetical protein